MEKKGARGIEDWEAALIKAMLAEGTLTKDQIVSYFTRPERTVNPWRLAEIEKGQCHSDVPPATRQQVEVYLRTFKSPVEARDGFMAQNPLHQVNLRNLFRLKDGTDDILYVDETAVECKEAFHRRGDGRADYARTIAGFANSRGGFLLFGIRDSDKKIVGLDANTISRFDGADLNRYMVDIFVPAPVWEKAEFSIAGKSILIIYVREAEKKPVICTKVDGRELKEADIYYRYPSETRRIRYAELASILDERTKVTEKRWANVFKQIEASGVENVAVLDTVRGEVSGYAGKFLIDEALIPKLKFVAEGHFTDREGAPTMRLVGDMKPISLTQLDGADTIVVKEHLTDSDVQHEFVNRSRVQNPNMYITRLAHSTKKWLPVYYFIRQAGLEIPDAIGLLQAEQDNRKSHLRSVVDRIKKLEVPSAARLISDASAEPERSQILAGTLDKPGDAAAAVKFSKAAMTLKIGEVNPDFILPTLAHCMGISLSSREIVNLFYAIAYVDVIWHQQIVKSSEGGSTAPR